MIQVRNKEWEQVLITTPTVGNIYVGPFGSSETPFQSLIPAIIHPGFDSHVTNKSAKSPQWLPALLDTAGYYSDWYMLFYELLLW